MKYIITAKNIQDDPCVTDPTKRTEIATELISTRMKALKMLSSGQISDTDTIVTRQDRFCLYDGIFKNLMDWWEYDNRSFYARVNDKDSEEIDLVSEINDNSIDSSENFKKDFYPIPKHAYTISLCELKDYERPFVCILVRGMQNHSEKNISESYWLDLINSLYCKTDLDIFVFGENDFVLEDRRVKKVNSFKGWCSLLSNKNCRAVVSPCSGGVYPVFYTGHENSRLIVIDELRLTEHHKNSPSFYNECISEKNIPMTIYHFLPSVEELINRIR